MLWRKRNAMKRAKTVRPTSTCPRAVFTCMALNINKSPYRTSIAMYGLQLQDSMSLKVAGLLSVAFLTKSGVRAGATGVTAGAYTLRSVLVTIADQLR